MDCGGVLVKYILFVFNILFVVCGLLLIIFGSLMVSNIGEIPSTPESIQANSVPIVILVLGCIIFVIAFLGCCGAIRENACCTMTYSVIMLTLFICQLALVIFIWQQRVQILDKMDDVIIKIWDQRHTDQKVMDALQISFKCCGKNGFTDYTLAGEAIPPSCCEVTATSCTAIEAISRPGCVRAFTNFWENSMNIIRYAGLGVAGVELVAFIFGCCLANQMRNKHRRSHY
uniref:Tetraspanin n=1 Tax=Glossina pallidipes TaxID=7398 RepID=A0A1A9Z7J0_GLOPL